MKNHKIKLILLALLILTSVNLFSQETNCECYSKSGVIEKIGIGGHGMFRDYTDTETDKAGRQYYWYAAYFPSEEPCYPRDNYWWQKVQAKIADAVERHPVYYAAKQQMPDRYRERVSVANQADIRQSDIDRVIKTAADQNATLIIIDANLSSFATPLQKCSQISKDKVTTASTGRQNPLSNTTQSKSNGEESEKVNSSNDASSDNTYTSIDSFETSYEVYNQNLQNAIASSFDSDGNIDVAYFVSNLPQATNKNQAYTNVAATGLAVFGDLMQQRRERLAKERSEWNAKVEVWREMYKDVKDGIGARDSNGEKTGTWIYFNDLFLIEKIATYENGAINGITLLYRKLLADNVFYYDTYLPVFGYHPKVYENNKEIKSIPYKWLWQRKIKEPDYYTGVSYRAGKYKKFMEKEGKNLDIGFYNSSNLDFTKKKRFSVKTKIGTLRYATYKGKSFPIDVFQLLNNNNVSIQEGLYNGQGQKIGNWYTFNPNDTYPKYDYAANTDPIEKISYSNGKKQGAYFSQFWEGQFSNDRKVGLWKSKKDPGLTIKFSSDGHTGLQEKKDVNGTIVEKAIVYDTKYIGEYQAFYPNGNLKLKGQYKDNAQIGEWSFYDINGQLIKTQFFEE